MTGLVLVHRAGAVAQVVLNRPEKLNALSPALMAELVGWLRRLDDDSAVRVIVLRGGERAFAAGADIGALADAHGERSSDSDFSVAWEAVASIRTPIVAEVRGWVLGGGLELAMACDVVVAADDARFGMPEAGLGAMPGAGGTQRLPRVVGKALALDLLLTGRRLTASEALTAGLVSRVAPVALIRDVTDEVARTIAAAAPLAAAAIKAAVHSSFETSLSEGVAEDRLAAAGLTATADHAEGGAAFRERRPPRFEGR